MFCVYHRFFQEDKGELEKYIRELEKKVFIGTVVCF